MTTSKHPAYHDSMGTTIRFAVDISHFTVEIEETTTNNNCGSNLIELIIAAEEKLSKELQERILRAYKNIFFDLEKVRYDPLGAAS
jgi:hypothetical protein